MPQRPVNIGALPNNGGGDPIRVAYDKLNGNDADLDARITGVATDVSGKAGRGRRAVAGTTITLIASDTYVGISNLTVPCTVTLPAAAGFPAGQPLYVADETGACSPTLLITIAGAGADTIAGQPSVSMGSPYQKLAFHSNGLNLWTVA